MKKVKRIFRMSLLIILICLACLGIGIGGAVTLPREFKREDKQAVKIELLDEESPDEKAKE